MPTPPDLYSGLPKDPKISPLVEVWKGAAKPIALVGLGLTALFGFFQHVTGGPNEVDEADEQEAKKTIGEPDQNETADDRAQVRHRRPLHAWCVGQSLA
jgi:hypothetical protein